MAGSVEAQPEEGLRATVPDNRVELLVAHTAGCCAVRSQRDDEAADPAQAITCHIDEHRFLAAVYCTIEPSNVCAAERPVVRCCSKTCRLFFGEANGSHEPASMVVQQELLLHQQQLVRWAAFTHLTCLKSKQMCRLDDRAPPIISIPLTGMRVECRHAAKAATVHCVLFIGSTPAEPHDEVWWYEGSSRSGSLRVHSLTTGATQVPTHSCTCCRCTIGCSFNA
jgi:hypothetical protein